MSNDRSSRKLLVTVCGGINYDTISITKKIPGRGETCNAESSEIFPGGKAANVAVALHRLSHNEPSEKSRETISGSENVFVQHGFSETEVRLVGCIGKDGDDLINGLRAQGVNVEGVKKNSAAMTSSTQIWVEKETRESSILVRPGANDTLEERHFKNIRAFGDVIPSMVITQLELPLRTAFKILKVAKENHIDTVLNPSPAHHVSPEVYKHIDHLIMNQSEAEIMTGRDCGQLGDGFNAWNQITDPFIDYGVKNVVITLGSRGAFFSRAKGQGGLVEADCVDKKRLKDTTGAGDTFVGAYCICWLKAKHGKEEWDLRLAVQYACHASARTIQAKGCQTLIPWANQVNLPIAT